jgi:hypothetical protein
MLLDEFLPEYDVRTIHSIRIAARPASVYASLRTADFDHWGVLRALFTLRMVPAFSVAPRETWRRLRREIWLGPVTLARVLEQGFTLLGERPEKELVVGTIGRFWHARAELWPTGPASFRETAPQGTAKGAWNFVIGTSVDGWTELTTETRVLCADVAARRRFRTYWTLIRLFSGLIRREMLAAIRATAEAADKGSYSRVR